MAEHCTIDISRYRAVLFDLDGVITDTMPIHLKAWQEAFKPFGVPVEAKDVYQREGMQTRALGKAIVDEKKPGLSNGDLEKVTWDKARIFQREAGLSARSYDGVRETLQMLRNNGIKTALVTGSNAAATGRVLSKTGLEGLFDAIVTGDDTTKGKPSPDPYLTAIKKLGVNHLNCVVVENAPLGIQAARAAGVDYVIALTTTLDSSHLRNADDIMASVSDLEKCLARRFAAMPGPASP